MSSPPSNLLGIRPDLDEILFDLAFLADYYRDFHPANTGDVSQLLSREVGEELVSIFAETISQWYEIARIGSLGELRHDGRTGYRSQGVELKEYYELTQNLAGRLCLVTCTGSQIPAIRQTIDVEQSGRLLNIVQLDETGTRIRIIYGNAQYGTIPSIETHVHLLANAMSILSGCENPATVHAHPFHLVTLGRHARIRGDFGRFNAALYTSIEGLNRNHPNLVGVVPYFESGSGALVENSIHALRRHGLVLWMNHGFVVRADDIRRAYTLLAYAEEAARAALDSLDRGHLRLPQPGVDRFLSEHDLLQAYRRLFGE